MAILDCFRRDESTASLGAYRVFTNADHEQNLHANSEELAEY